MVQNSQTRGQIRLALSRLLEGPHFHPMKTTQLLTGGSATTAVDSALIGSIFPDDHFNGFNFRNQSTGVDTFVTDFVNSTGTLTVPSGTASASTNVYELHNRAAWVSSQYDDAIAQAVEAAGHASALGDVVDYSLGIQDGRSLYPLPASTFSYLHKVSVDVGRAYHTRHAPTTFDTLKGIKSTTGQVYLAQSFQTSDSNPVFQLGDIYLLLAKVGSPTGTLTLTVEADSSGAPSGTALATATLASSGVSAEAALYRFAPTVRPLLTNDTTYWIKVTDSSAVDASNYVGWALDSDAGYDDGSPLTGTSVPAWTALTGDFIFTIRKLQPTLQPLEWRKHWTVLNDSTRYLALTQAGMNFLRANDADGSPLVLEGQGRPTTPTADTDTIQVPFDYIVAHAGTTLLSLNTSWKTDARALLQLWDQRITKLEPAMRTPLKSGAQPVEAM